MDDAAAKEHLHRYLQHGRDALLWKLEGASEHDVRRPLTATGTNLLGLVKHVAIVELGYFGPTFGRRVPEVEPWLADDVEDNADMWATAGESRADVVALYRRAWAVTDATVTDLPLDAEGTVSWWPEARRHPTLHAVLVHVIAETHRHAGHADVLRESVDGAAGMRADAGNLPERDAAWWAAHRERLERVAREAAGE